MSKFYWVKEKLHGYWTVAEAHDDGFWSLIGSDIIHDKKSIEAEFVFGDEIAQPVKPC